MIIKCAYCEKFYKEEDGVMDVGHVQTFIFTNPVYVFTCKNCMSDKLKKNFEEFKKKN